MKAAAPSRPKKDANFPPTLLPVLSVRKDAEGLMTRTKRQRKGGRLASQKKEKENFIREIASIIEPGSVEPGPIISTLAQATP